MCVRVCVCVRGGGGGGGRVEGGGEGEGLGRVYGIPTVYSIIYVIYSIGQPSDCNWKCM